MEQMTPPHQHSMWQIESVDEPSGGYRCRECGQPTDAMGNNLPAPKGHASDLMTMLDEAKNLVATFTGIRQEFIAQGWSAEGAERMVHAMVLGAASRQKH